LQSSQLEKTVRTTLIIGKQRFMGPTSRPLKILKARQPTSCSWYYQPRAWKIHSVNVSIYMKQHLIWKLYAKGSAINL